MMHKFLSLLSLCIALLTALSVCKKKNYPPNRPSVFNIVEDTSQLGENILFTASAIDPDNDSIAIHFDWSYGDTSDWSEFVANGDTVSMYHSFSSAGTFYIRAQANDIHKETSDWSEPDSIVIQTWALVWTCARHSASLSRRDGLTSVIFDNKIWVLGGSDWDYDKYSNDVWYSLDGLNWICATDSAQWAPRSGHTSVVFNNKMWILGGGW